MSDDLVDRLARTLLYEGYLLYPYRPSAVKNRLRFNFGVLYPAACCQSGDRSHLQAECPIEGPANTRVAISVRFLQLVERGVAGAPEATRLEGVERVVAVGPWSLRDLRRAPRRSGFLLSADDHVTVSPPGPTKAAPAIIGEIEASALGVAEGVDVLRVQVRNIGEPDGREADRDRALQRAMVSAHVVIEAQEGALVSLLDPPEPLREAVARCTNLGVWPVLVGEPGSHDRMLASPIILYDYPQIAPESAGDLFDGTEIDEILALRILTLTDEEKREVRDGDAHARLILDRTEALPPEHWAKLHGAVRGLRRVTGGAP